MEKILFLALFFVFVSSQARALTELEVSGELDLAASIWNLPTGERGNSAFNVPTFFLNFAAPLKDDNLLMVRFEGSEEQAYSKERFNVKVREAYLDLVSTFKDIRALRVGLIPQVWQEAQYEDWEYRFLGNTAWAMTEKWGYLTPSDLGVSFMDQLPADWGEMAVTLGNGEGPREKESGPHKEMSLFVRLTKWEPWSFSFNYVRGNYDRYGDEVGLKERIQALAVYRHQKWSAGLELMASRDPADALTNLVMADGVDVLAQGGQAVRGQAASLFTTFSTGPQAEMMLRYDYLNAAEGESGKDLQMGMVALNYLISEDIRGAIMVDYTRYAEDFAPGVRDRSKLSCALQVLF